MAVYRGPLPTDHFAMIPNAWLRDPKLTAKEKVVMSIVASHREGYRLTMQQLVSEMYEGRDAVYGALRGLVDKGWMVTLQTRDAETGRLGEVDYKLTGGPEEPRPEGAVSPRSAQRQKRAQAAVDANDLPVTENPEPGLTCDDAPKERVESPIAGNPDTENPDTDTPYTGEPTHRRPSPQKTNLQEDTSADAEVPGAPEQQGMFDVEATDPKVKPHRLPAGWKPSPELVAASRKRFPELDNSDFRDQLTAFQAHWDERKDKLSSKSNWNRAWMNWLAKPAAAKREREERYQRARAAGQQSGGSRGRGYDDKVWQTEQGTTYSEAEFEAAFGSRRAV